MKNKNTKKADKIKTSFTANRLTNYSGLIPIIKFMDKLGLRELFQGLNIRIGKNAKYSNSDILSMITLGIISGKNRISKIEVFSRDPLIREVFGIEEKIDEDTIANRIKRVSMLQTTELMDIIGQL